MKKQRTYHFRDNRNLLENIEHGNRSKFIRESLTLRINIDDAVYKELQANNQELINQYTDIVNLCDQSEEMLLDEIAQMKNFRKRIKIQLKKQLKEAEELQQRIDTKKTLIKDNDVETHRKEATKTIIKNIILRKADPSADVVDIDYLMTYAGFDNKKEFKIHIQEYIQENVKTGDIVGKTVLKQEDIDYLKRRINQMV